MKFEVYKLSNIFKSKINFIFLTYLIILLLEVNLTGIFNPKYNEYTLFEYLGFLSVHKSISIHLCFNLAFFLIFTYYYFIYDLKYYNTTIFNRLSYKKWIFLKLFFNTIVLLLLKLLLYGLLLFFSKKYINISFNEIVFFKDFLLTYSFQTLFVILLLNNKTILKSLILITYIVSLIFFRFGMHIIITQAIFFIILFAYTDIKKTLEVFR